MHIEMLVSSNTSHVLVITGRCMSVCGSRVQ